MRRVIVTLRCGPRSPDQETDGPSLYAVRVREKNGGDILALLVMIAGAALGGVVLTLPPPRERDDGASPLAPRARATDR